QGMRTPDPNYSNNIGLDGDLMPVGHAFQDETAISSPFPLLSPVQSLLFSRTQLSKLFRNVPLITQEIMSPWLVWFCSWRWGMERGRSVAEAERNPPTPAARAGSRSAVRARDEWRWVSRLRLVSSCERFWLGYV